MSLFWLSQSPVSTKTSDEKLVCSSEYRITLMYSKHLQGVQLTSTITLGCSPSPRYRSACFISSPMNSTVDVVPSLHSDDAQTWQ